MAGYSGTPLLQKLGIKPGMRLKLIQIPEYYYDLLGTLPPDVKVITRGEADFIHLFIKKTDDLRMLGTLKEQVARTGMIWASWEKKKVKQPGAVNENIVREKALGLGLVDIKVCAVNEEWSGLKLVWRKENR